MAFLTSVRWSGVFVIQRNLAVENETKTDRHISVDLTTILFLFTITVRIVRKVYYNATGCYWPSWGCGGAFKIWATRETNSVLGRTATRRSSRGPRPKEKKYECYLHHSSYGLVLLRQQRWWLRES
jgi:hypothetical protein